MDDTVSLSAALVLLLTSPDDSWIELVDNDGGPWGLPCMLCLRFVKASNFEQNQVTQRSTHYFTFSHRWQKDERYFFKKTYCLCDQHWKEYRQPGP